MLAQLLNGLQSYLSTSISAQRATHCAILPQTLLAFLSFLCLVLLKSLRGYFTHIVVLAAEVPEKNVHSEGLMDAC